MKILVTGAGGFIGGHLIKYLLNKYTDATIYASDLKLYSQWLHKFDPKIPLYSLQVEDRNDLRDYNTCIAACNDVDWVFNLACDRGGIQYITENQVEAITSSLINLNLLRAAIVCKVKRYFFASSVCVYSPSAQETPNIINEPIQEHEVWNLGRPNEAYGIEKLFAEEACHAFHNKYGLETRIARFNTVYGSNESIGDNREKAPVALCRKVYEAIRNNTKTVEIWGDGKQQRTFLHVDDCIKGIDLIMNGNDSTPFNLGPQELVSINELVNVIEESVGIKLQRIYNLNKPRGSFIRHIDCSKFQKTFDWNPHIKIKEGIPRLYKWVQGKLNENFTS